MTLPSLAFGLLLISLLIRVTDRQPWSATTYSTTNTSITFQAQFTNIEELLISSFHSTHAIRDLRTDSLALEDLSHAANVRFDELGVPSELPALFHNISTCANAVAETLEQFYLKVTGMIELWVTI